ncbi:site-specific DNA-methyltransferase [Pseudoalteromonas sp. CH_XMU1449-3]|uniref:site-specific DNA-methyltransferase n=1 Tax=Pseudoalteromonas sp. CH_XMU1449-3 TaxID=3107774 RepID=UPI0030083DB0
MSSVVHSKIANIAASLGLEMQLDLDFDSIIKNLNDLDLKADCTLFCGDNLDVLASLYESQQNNVDFCYIDPPYNTTNSFIYNDTRVSQQSGLFGSHSSWMSFMLPRLVWARELLKDTGIITVSIDDYEQPYLRILLDTIFGEDNFIGNIAVCRSVNGKGSKKNIAVNHEYVLVYGKSSKSKILGMADDASKYDKEDEYGRYKVDGLFRKKGDASRREDRPNMFYPLYYNDEGKVFTENTTGNLKEAYPLDSKGIERRWLWGKDKAKNEAWKLYASPNGVIYVKNYSTAEKRTKIRSLWSDNRYLTERATKQIKDIYGDKVFETPKPIELIEDLLFSHTSDSSLILDFFAGTGTTAHAAHNLNCIDGGKRKVILVEKDEPIAPSHIAAKMGFNLISDITEKRLKHISNIDTNYKFSVHNFN